MNLFGMEQLALRIEYPVGFHAPSQEGGNATGEGNTAT